MKRVEARFLRDCGDIVHHGEEKGECDAHFKADCVELFTYWIDPPPPFTKLLLKSLFIYSFVFKEDNLGNKMSEKLTQTTKTCMSFSAISGHDWYKMYVLRDYCML